MCRQGLWYSSSHGYNCHTHTFTLIKHTARKLVLTYVNPDMHSRIYTHRSRHTYTYRCIGVYSQVHTHYNTLSASALPCRLSPSPRFPFFPTYSVCCHRLSPPHTTQPLFPLVPPLPFFLPFLPLLLALFSLPSSSFLSQTYKT